MAFIRVKYSKGNPYLYLVESYREGGKVRQRVLEYLGPSRDISQKQFLNVVNQSYKSSDKMGDVVKVPELTKRIQKKTGLSKEEVHKKLHDAYIEKKIDLQPGKGEGSLKGEDDATFQYMQPRKLGTTKQVRRRELGTTTIKIKQHFDKINKETRAGNMVQIPKLWRKVKKEGISREEFEEALYKMEKERIIDLQVASATYVLKPEDKKLGMPHPTRGHINYVVWREPPKKRKRARRKHDKYECGLCGKQFQNKSTLSWHLKDKHMYVGKVAKEEMIELEGWG